MSQPTSVSPRNITNVKLATCAILAAVGIVLSYLNPFGYILIYGAKLNPFAHFINVIAGVLLGPWYALGTAVTIAVIRNIAGIGTWLAFPGGMSGALVVGLVRDLLLRTRPKSVKSAGFTEPIGTVFIGGTISVVFGLTTTSLWILWIIFAVSSIAGMLLGWVVLKVLDRTGVAATFLPITAMGSCEAPQLEGYPSQEKPAPP